MAIKCLVGTVVGILFLTFLYGSVFWILRPFFRGIFSGVHVSIFQIIGMNLRGNPPILIIDATLILQKSGTPSTLNEVEACYIVNRGKVNDPQTLARLVPKYREEVEKKR